MRAFSRAHMCRSSSWRCCGRLGGAVVPAVPWFIATPIAPVRWNTTTTSSAPKYDLFGYQVDTNTAPWIAKIRDVKYYDDAGSLMVEMNVKNCPPDLATYNATLQKIYECPSKAPEPVENESKFCAMMDLMEEMSHRNKIKPSEASWTWVMKECIASSNFRLGYVIERVMRKECGGCPAELVSANEANASKAAKEGREHPSHLAQQTGIFDSVPEGTGA